MNGSEEARLIIRFAPEMDSAIARAEVISVAVPHSDLEMLAAERLLGYGHSMPAWARGAIALRSDSRNPLIEEMVQRALNTDLMDYVQAALRLHRMETGREATERELRRAFLFTQNTAERDAAMSDWLTEQFPMLIMHFYNGLSERVMASELGVSRGLVQAGLESERKRFVRWAYEVRAVGQRAALRALLTRVTHTPASPRLRSRRPPALEAARGPVTRNVVLTPRTLAGPLALPP
jgi:hypothetical protein